MHHLLLDIVKYTNITLRREKVNIIWVVCLNLKIKYLILFRVQAERSVYRNREALPG